jgi:hypothetical protein
MNGITFYMAGTSTNDFKITGGGFTSLAFPNPCPGQDIMGTNSVPFYDPANPGQKSGTNDANGYTYPATSLAYLDNGGSISNPIYSGPNPYPSADLSIQGEQLCDPLGSHPNAGNEWANEFGVSGTTNLVQHLHFFVFARDGNALITLAGSGQQNWWGILYNPGSATQYNVSGCSNRNKCSITLTGTSGGNNGPPMMIGQVVGDNMSYSGSATAELFYRPCSPSSLCLSGAGSGLVE